MKKTASLIAAIAAIVVYAAPSFAADLQTARTSAAVGETAAGYIEKINGGAEIDALVAEVNSKRRAEYARISNENGQPLDVIARIAAGNIIKSLPKGAKYQDAKGNWLSK